MVNGNATCTCPAQWSGSSCESDVDECKGSHGCPASTPCENLPGGYTCAGELADFPLPRGNTARALGEFERGAGTVLDKLTGLRWAVAIYETDPAQNPTWAEASKYCDDSMLGGFTDWRLPNFVELSTLVHGVTSNDVVGYPALGDHVLAELKNGNSSNLWTLNTTVDGKHSFFWYWQGWLSDFSDPGLPARAAVRCVRRDQVKCTLPPDKRFTRQGGSVVDGCTKLSWTYDDSPSKVTSASAQTYCSGLTTDNRKWRVPSFLELFSLVDVARTGGLVSAFAAPRAAYMSSTGSPIHPAEGGGVQVSDPILLLDNGDMEVEKYAANLAVFARCVSDPTP